MQILFSLEGMADVGWLAKAQAMEGRPHTWLTLRLRHRQVRPLQAVVFSQKAPLGRLFWQRGLEDGGALNVA